MGKNDKRPWCLVKGEKKTCRTLINDYKVLPEGKNSWMENYRYAKVWGGKIPSISEALDLIKKEDDKLANGDEWVAVGSPY